ncbi:MAG: DNA adenine methylase [Vagococcus sp.]|uniref:DNA adenine methylase n=1 Tax=Vagococcus sp. TaxID=1933889 RepID=UPI002FCAC71F
MKRVLNYPGSKWSMADMIIKLMPPHKAYLEPFLGSGAVFFTKEKVVLETLNDADGRLVNMFCQMRNNKQKLQELISLTPYSRAEYDLSKIHSDDLLEDARRMLVRCWMAIGGKTNADVGWRRNISWNGPYNTYEWNDMINRIEMAAARLKDAQIECKNAIDLIQECNQKDVMIYADPPYLDETRVSKHYSNEMTNEEHIQLLEVLKDHTGPVIISGYNSELYSTMLSDWYVVKKETKIGITSLKKRTIEEVLWMNYEPNGQINLLEG